MIEDPTLLTPEEAAALLRIEPRTLSNWRAKRQGPPFVKIGLRCVRYRRADLLAFIRITDAPQQAAA